MGHTPTVAMINMLAPIWQRVLQCPSARPDDNFFDLGGDPASAVQLFSEITKASGRELPPLTIYQAPTMVALAALLEQPTPARFPTLVLMKAGALEPPVMFTHGLGGSIMEIFHLVKSIQTDHPIYGLQSHGFESDQEPTSRIEDTATIYLEAMKKVQPRGPYALIGYSFGGLVMMEIAQRLRQSGERVVLLEMLETFPHNNLLPLAQRITLFAGRVKRHASVLARLPMRKRIRYFASRTERLNASWNHGTEGIPPETGIPGGPALERYKRAETLALLRYRPRFYAGKINYVRAAKISSSFPDDPRAIWQNLAKEFEIDTLPGDHFAMVTSQCEGLASLLSRHIAAAFSGE